MSISITKSRLTLIFVIIFTIIIAAVAIGTAVLLQSRSVGGDKNKAATCQDACNSTNICATDAQLANLLAECNAQGGLPSCPQAQTYNNILRDQGICKKNLANCLSNCTGPTSPASMCTVNGVQKNKSTFCGLAPKDVASGELDAWCGNSSDCGCTNGTLSSNQYLCGNLNCTVNDPQIFTRTTCTAADKNAYCQQKQGGTCYDNGAGCTACASSTNTPVPTVGTVGEGGNCSGGKQCQSGLFCATNNICMQACNGSNTSQCACGANPCDAGRNRCASGNPAQCLGANECASSADCSSKVCLSNNVCATYSNWLVSGASCRTKDGFPCAETQFQSVPNLGDPGVNGVMANCDCRGATKQADGWYYCNGSVGQMGSGGECGINCADLPAGSSGNAAICGNYYKCPGTPMTQCYKCQDGTSGRACIPGSLVTKGQLCLSGEGSDLNACNNQCSGGNLTCFYCDGPATPGQITCNSTNQAGLRWNNTTNSWYCDAGNGKTGYLSQSDCTSSQNTNPDVVCKTIVTSVPPTTGVISSSVPPTTRVVNSSVPPTTSVVSSSVPVTTPLTQRSCAGIAVTRNSIALTSGSIVTAGDVLSVTITGTNTTESGFDTTITGGSAVARQSGTNAFSGSFTVPSTGTNVQFIGFASNSGQEYRSQLCNLSLVISSTTPRCEVDKIAVLQNSTPITGIDTCKNVYPNTPGCESVGLAQNDKVTYKVVVSNKGTAPMTNVTVSDSLTITTGTGTAVFTTDNNSNPAASLRKCSGFDATSGTCTGYVGDTASISTPATFAGTETSVTWNAISSIAPGEYYEARLVIQATASGNYVVTNGVSVASSNQSLGECRDFISHPLGDVPPSIVKEAFATSDTNNATQIFTAGDIVEYHITLRDRSSTVDYSNLTVVDNLSLPYATYFDQFNAMDSNPSTPNNYRPTFDANGNGGNGQVTWTGVSIPTGGSISLKFSLRLRSDIVGQPPECIVRIPNNAIIISGIPTGEKPTNSYVINVNTRLCSPSLQLVKTSTPQSTTPGGTFNVSLKATATGSYSSTIKEITDYLPTGFTYTSGTAAITVSNGSTTSVTATVSGQNIVFAINNTGGIILASGEYLTITFKVKAPTQSDCLTYINTAIITNPPGPSSQSTMAVCLLPNTGIVDSLIVSMGIGGGLVAVSYVFYKYNLTERFGLLIKNRGRKK
ncbi:MAG: hypothetical protein WCJ19_02765 [bacterium]